MAIFGFGRKKEQEVVKSQPQYLEAGNIGYNNIVQTLFSTYLINTYSHYLSNGGEKGQSCYTTMAKYQKCTFAEYCEFIQQGCDLASKYRFNQERGQLINAKNLLTNHETLDQDYLKGLCSYVSRVYECTLASSYRSQQILASNGVDPSQAEISYSQLKGIQSSLENGSFQFTSHGFTRGSEVSSEGGYTNVENAKQEIASINTENPDLVPWALDMAVKGSYLAQNIIMTMNKDFQMPAPQQTDITVEQ